jgi:multimeric flavodoxin WrbA
MNSWIGETIMRITSLLGSAKKKGNTATVLNWVEEELKSLGNDVEK